MGPLTELDFRMSTDISGSCLAAFSASEAVVAGGLVEVTSGMILRWANWFSGVVD